MEMKEFTFRAVLIGLFLTALLGSANAYLGLKAGMTIAATYPAAVISMALLRLMKGSLLEENIARTVDRLASRWQRGHFHDSGVCHGRYMAGAQQGSILEVSGSHVDRRDARHSLRDVVAASDGRGCRSAVSGICGRLGDSQGRAAGAKAAKILFANMGFGAFMYLMGAVNVFNPSNTFPVKISALGKSAVAYEHKSERSYYDYRRCHADDGARHQPCLSGVGYIIGPRLAALNFAGGVLAWDCSFRS